MKKVILFVILHLLAPKYIVAQKLNSFSKDNIIYSLQQDFKKSRIKIDFVNKSDGTKTFVSKKVLRDNNHAYVKFSLDNYYLSVDSLPIISSDICNDLRKISIDTTLVYGEPFSMLISMVFVIDKYGRIETYGIARGTNSKYYEDATLKVLQNHSFNGCFKPAKVGNRAVSNILRMSFNFGQGKCTILTNSPPFFTLAGNSWHSR
jgi:hypothetical protein